MIYDLMRVMGISFGFVFVIMIAVATENTTLGANTILK
jgi:hypothetical protein